MTLSVRSAWRPSPETRFRVSSGHVWATRDGDAADHVLGPGDDFVAHGRGWVVSALKGSAEVLVGASHLLVAIEEPSVDFGHAQDTCRPLGPDGTSLVCPAGPGAT